MAPFGEILTPAHPDLGLLLKELARPEAFPVRPAVVQVVQTHISAVFIADRDVFKVKKPVDFGFVDYSTPERRKHFCEEEVRLNRRLAPEIYLGVVPITPEGEHLRFGGTSAGVEFAVHMRRLSNRDGLGALLAAGWAGQPEIANLGRLIATFHGSAEPRAEGATYGSFETVEENCLANLECVRPFVGSAVTEAVFREIDRGTRSMLQSNRERIESRWEAGVPRDTHGDLRLDHVFRQPDPPGWQIVDCIEFNESLRITDPVADIAFLAMDMQRAGYRSASDWLLEAYFTERNDPDGRELLPLYMAYRAMVRCKVSCLQSADTAIATAGRQQALQNATAYALLALGLLAPAASRPCMILLAGLPGTGKSHLARSLTADGKTEWIRTDVVRKELAASLPATHGDGGIDEGIYSDAWSDATYRECLRRAEQAWCDGKRVLIDACFVEERRREPFLDAAGQWAIPTVVLHLTADSEVVRTRLEQRTGDPSDADWATYLALRQRWEEFPDSMADRVANLLADRSPEDVLEQAQEALRKRGL